MATITLKQQPEAVIFAGASIAAGDIVAFLHDDASGADLPIGTLVPNGLGLLSLFSGEDDNGILPAVDDAALPHGTSGVVFQGDDVWLTGVAEAELAREQHFTEATGKSGMALWEAPQAGGNDPGTQPPTTEPPVTLPPDTPPVTVPPDGSGPGSLPGDGPPVPPPPDGSGTPPPPADTGSVPPAGDGSTGFPLTADQLAAMPGFHDVTVAASTLTLDLIDGAKPMQLLSDFQALNTSMLAFVTGVLGTEAASGITDPATGRAFGQGLGEAIGAALRDALAAGQDAPEAPQPGGVVPPAPDVDPGFPVDTGSDDGRHGAHGSMGHPPVDHGWGGGCHPDTGHPAHAA